MGKTWWARAAGGLILGLLFLTLSRAALLERRRAVEEPLIDAQEAMPLGIASRGSRAKRGSRNRLQQPPKIDAQGRPAVLDPRDAQVALSLEDERSHHRAGRRGYRGQRHRDPGGSWWSQGYRPAAVGGLLALGGIFGGLCWAGELGCGHSHGGGSSPPGPPGPPGPPRPPRPPFIPTPHPPQPPVSPFH